jgi:hypothetical protein
MQPNFGNFVIDICWLVYPYVFPTTKREFKSLHVPSANHSNVFFISLWTPRLLWTLVQASMIEIWEPHFVLILDGTTSLWKWVSIGPHLTVIPAIPLAKWSQFTLAMWNSSHVAKDDTWHGDVLLTWKTLT